MHRLVRLAERPGGNQPSLRPRLGAVQNSTSENNYLENGFLASSPADELPGRSGIAGLCHVAGGRRYRTGDRRPRPQPGAARERFTKIEQRRKALIRECESEPGYRCQGRVVFFGGLQYKLIRRLEIRDVRIVYSPADAVGKYGGDIDNWRWPRHTGDFAFYRAYVGPDRATRGPFRGQRPVFAAALPGGIGRRA